MGLTFDPCFGLSGSRMRHNAQIRSDHTIIIRASFTSKQKKIEPLETARIMIEIVKHLIRTEHEMKIIDQKIYIRIESTLIEISKMTNGWIKYLTTQNPA